MPAMRKRPEESIRDLVSYDPKTGLFIRIGSSREIFRNKRADRPMINGYRRVYVAGQEYAAHRLAWFLHYGDWPDLDIDHINCDPSDNRIINLRLATKSQNNANRSPLAGKLKGTTFLPRYGKYQAQIRVKGVSRYLGVYQTEELAHQAYSIAALECFKEFARVEGQPTKKSQLLAKGN